MKSLITLGDEFACVHPVSRFSQHVGDIDILRPPQLYERADWSVGEETPQPCFCASRQKKKNLNDRGKGAVKMNPCFTKQKLFLGGDCYSHTHTETLLTKPKSLSNPAGLLQLFRAYSTHWD